MKIVHIINYTTVGYTSSIKQIVSAQFKCKNNIDSTDVAEIDGLTSIIANEMQSEQSEIILDKGDPRNCQLYEKGTCKYLQKDFAQPHLHTLTG